MNEIKKIDLDLLPMGYCEAEIFKQSANQYTYKILYSNSKFRQMLSKKKDSDDHDFIICNELEAELFPQNKLKSYFNVILNNSLMEFQLYCNTFHKNLLIKITTYSKNQIRMFISTLPHKVVNSHLKENSPNFFKVLENSFDYLIIMDKDLIIKYCNNNTRDFLGIDERSEDSIDALKFIHPDDLPIAYSAISQLRERPNKEISSEIRVIDKNNDTYLMNFRIKNMLDSKGINGFVINAKDITEENKKQQSIIENELYLESLFKAIPNLIFVLDYQGTFLDFKSKTTNKLAFSPSEFIGKRISSLFPPYISSKVIKRLQDLKERKEASPISYQMNGKSGSLGYYECHLSIINEDKVLAIVNDVTNLKEAEETLKNNQRDIQKKLDAITSPQGDLSDLELGDLVNLDELKDLFQTINELTDIPITLLDNKGKALFTIGASSICKDFHLMTKFSSKRCTESNEIIPQGLKIGESKLYKCNNNIWNFASPVFIGNRVIATLVVCQFRLAEDSTNYQETLRHQANIYQFNKEEYLKAYYSLPIIEKSLIIKISNYYRDLLSKITALSYAQIKQARTASQLKQREEKLAQITDNMTDVVFTTNLAFELIYISPSVRKLLGFTPQEYLQLPIEHKFPPQSVKIFSAALNSQLVSYQKGSSDKEANIFELQVYTKDKNLMDVSFNTTFLNNDNNEPIGIIGSVRDITKQKIYEYELQKQLQLQSLLSSIAMHYINLPLDDISDSIADSLKKFAEFAQADRAYIFKYDWEKRVTSNTYEWCKTGIEPQIDNLQNVPIVALPEWNEAHNAGELITIDCVDNLPDSDPKKDFLSKQSIKSSISVPLMNKNECIGFVGFDSVEKTHYYTKSDITILKVFANLLVNISNRISLEEELNKEKERATESDKLKSNLLKNISHEFRTPLNGIIGLSELLQTKPIDSEYQKMANMIFTSGVRLNYVLDSIMLLSQLESLTETKFINLEPINISSFLTTLAVQYKGQVELKGLEFLLDIQENLRVNINENLFRQAVTHIINNAIKYTQEGSIKISCRFLEQDDIIELSIEDSGIGIPKDSQELIFKDFRQVSEGFNRAYEGCGLGLPIAKKAIELMNGKIFLDSEFEKGARFTIILPPAKNKHQPSNPKSDLEKKIDDISIIPKENRQTVLIVEDNKVNQKLARSILKKHYEVDSAYDGETAIDMIAQKQYDVILMDIHLGEGLDGIQTTKIIKNDLRYSKTPIIAVTGYTMLGDKDHILKEGCSHYLSKPYSKNELLNIIDMALN